MEKNQTARSLSAEAYDAIKDAICTGKFAEGDILSGLKLSKTLAMSRTPVRDAVRLLESEGFLEVKSGIGILVKTISVQDIKNLYAVRTEMEILAATTAVYQITAEELDALEKSFLSLKAAYANGGTLDQKTYLDLDWELHELIVDRCGNSYIQTIMSMIYSNIRRYQRFSFEALNNLSESVDRHLRIINVLRLQDIELLKTELRGNIDKGKELLFPME